jgi:hypothetical protein
VELKRLSIKLASAYTPFVISIDAIGRICRNPISSNDVEGSRFTHNNFLVNKIRL